jgi:hypothetical protein
MKTKRKKNRKILSFSLTNLADFHLTDTRAFKREAKRSGLANELPKCLEYKPTFYYSDMLIVEKYFGPCIRWREYVGLPIPV